MGRLLPWTLKLLLFPQKTPSSSQFYTFLILRHAAEEIPSKTYEFLFYCFSKHVFTVAPHSLNECFLTAVLSFVGQGLRACFEILYCDMKQAVCRQLRNLFLVLSKLSTERYSCGLLDCVQWHSCLICTAIFLTSRRIGITLIKCLWDSGFYIAETSRVCSFIRFKAQGKKKTQKRKAQESSSVFLLGKNLQLC